MGLPNPVKMLNSSYILNVPSRALRCTRSTPGNSGNMPLPSIKSVIADKRHSLFNAPALASHKFKAPGPRKFAQPARVLTMPLPFLPGRFG